MSSQKYQERSRRERDETYETRRNKALSQGTRVEFITCPLCGRNRPLEMWGNEVRFEVKPDYAIIQVRYGGGRGSGFFLNENESVKLEEMKEKYPELYINLKNEVFKLNEILQKL